MTIDELKAKKRELGYSNEMVAELSQVPLGTVQKIFSGETRSPRYGTLQKLEKVLGNVVGVAPYNFTLSEGVRAAESVGYQFYCPIRVGEELVRFAGMAKNWKRRECYSKLRQYVLDDIYNKVLILYGLRRTGKTTLIKQMLLDMDEDMLRKSAFIQVRNGVGMAEINKDMKYLEQNGYRYIFIDEVTIMDDFIESAALFSDIFAASGMKIILSGTDSLGFVMAEDDQLYDRCIFIHTTFIPYREFENVLGIRGIDEYIRYGGTMCRSGGRYNDEIFSSSGTAGEYVDSAIAHNIQHSLKNYQYGGHFGPLRQLYDKDELTSAINRVVEDINHRFTVDVITRDWKSNDLKISAANLRRDRDRPTDFLDEVDIDNQLKELLEIRNKNEMSVEIDEAAADWLKSYMHYLDLVVDVETRFMDNFNYSEKRTVLTQPGLRYSQADALVQSLMGDDVFRTLSLNERNRIIERIRNEIKGRMMEDIILLETMVARPDSQVFKLRFDIGEFDMVVVNPNDCSCEIYEIKHSDKAVPEQCIHLLDRKKCDDTEFRYGDIKGKYVIYRGESKCVMMGEEIRNDNTMNIAVDDVIREDKQSEAIEYINVEGYLNDLRCPKINF